jgi:general secretion pathway protein I
MPGNQPLHGTRRKEEGFTLLEVIVALAIASLMLIGLFRAGSGGLFAADNAARVDEAIERAQSHLAAFARAGALVPGELEGDDGGGYRWAALVRPIAVEPVTAASATPPQALYAIQVRISWSAAGRPRSVVLETRRLAPAPGSE